MDKSGQPTKQPYLFGQSPIAKHISTTLFIIATAFFIGATLHGGSGADRSGQGMVMIGLTIVAAPTVAIGGSLAFIFRRTVFSDICGGAILFATVLFGTLYLLG